MRVAGQFLPQHRQRVDGQEIHRIHQEDPDEHGQREWGDEFTRFLAVDDGFGLVGNHFKQDFQRCLRPPGNASSGRTRDAEHEEQADHPGQH